MEDRKYALVTGASGGLGRAFAECLAKRGYSLLLTGRNADKLAFLSSEIRGEYPEIAVKVYSADLADGEARKRLMEKMEGENIRLSLLVNAAGADIQKGLTEYDEDKIAFQCRVNFEAAVSLCRFAIANKAERLEIINISSVSGIYPMPYFAIYSATKGALTSFSQSIREEMKGKGIAVTAILPGAMPTRADIKEQIEGQGLWGRLAVKTPEEVAKASLKAVRKNKRKIVVGFWNKVMRVCTAPIPTAWRLKFIAKRWSKITKDAF